MQKNFFKQLLGINLPVLTLLMTISCYDDTAILERLDNLEGTTIASINQQISSINSSINGLEGVDNSVKSEIAQLKDDTAAWLQALELLLNKLSSDVNVNTEDILSLKDKVDSIITQLEFQELTDKELDKRIGELRLYVDALLTDNQSWCEVTFATLEKQNEIFDILATLSLNDDQIRQNISEVGAQVSNQLKSYVDSIAVNLETNYSHLVSKTVSDLEEKLKQTEKSLGASIASQINETVASLKAWVNEQLAGYVSVANLDAQLKVISGSIQANASDIKEVKEETKLIQSSLESTNLKSATKPYNTLLE